MKIGEIYSSGKGLGAEICTNLLFVNVSFTEKQYQTYCHVKVKVEIVTSY